MQEKLNSKKFKDVFIGLKKTLFIYIYISMDNMVEGL